MAKLTMRLQLLMKLFNTVVGMAGFFMVAYGVWLIKVWQSDIEPYSYHHQTSIPWFIHAFIGLGISSCAISCLGHFAAHTADSNLLSYYVSLMSLLLLLEIATMTDMFLSFAWLKDITNDPTGGFDKFKDFVEASLDICRWEGVFIVLAQVVSILLAIVMRIQDTDLGNYYVLEHDSAPYTSYISPGHGLYLA